MTKKEKRRIKLIYLGIIVIFALLSVSVYFIAGEQFLLRESRGNIGALKSESGCTELYEGEIVEQHFSAEIQMLDEISVQFGTYLRTCNTGNMYIDLINYETNEVLISGVYNVAEIGEGEFISLRSEKALNMVYGKELVIKIYSDSLPGQAVSPMMSFAEHNIDSDGENKEYTLYINNEKVNGTLCFTASGRDEIWTGKHYMIIMLCLGGVISVYLLISYIRFSRGKNSLIPKLIYALDKYKFLIKQLVNRDFKAKYKRSVLGVMWSFINPLLTMMVQYIVFSNIFKYNIPYFPVYLLTGTILFHYFTEATGMALSSVVGNARLITKVYIPKYIYPLTRIISSLINLLISFIPLFIVIIISGLSLNLRCLLLIYPVICLVIFCLGVGMLLSSMMVFFRDTQFLWGVLTMIWTYLTPLFYPESILSENLKWVLQVNPMYYYIKFARMCIIDGVSPEPIFYVQCFLFSLASLILGTVVFKKTQNKFVLYL